MTLLLTFGQFPTDLTQNKSSLNHLVKPNFYTHQWCLSCQWEAWISDFGEIIHHSLNQHLRSWETFHTRCTILGIWTLAISFWKFSVLWLKNISQNKQQKLFVRCVKVCIVMGNTKNTLSVGARQALLYYLSVVIHCQVNHSKWTNMAHVWDFLVIKLWLPVKASILLHWSVQDTKTIFCKA